MNIIIYFALPAKPFAVRRSQPTGWNLWQRLWSWAAQILHRHGPDQLQITTVLIVLSDDA